MTTPTMQSTRVHTFTHAPWFDEKFFWYVDHATAALQQSGFQLIAIKQVSAISWGIAVET